MSSIKTNIAKLESPGRRLNAVFTLASLAYDDDDLAREFVQEQHRGHTAMALGAPDMNTFVDVRALLGTADGTRLVIEYLQDKQVRGRLAKIFGDKTAPEIFMGRYHPALGASPSLIIKTYDNGYEMVMQALDAAEAGVYM